MALKVLLIEESNMIDVMAKKTTPTPVHWPALLVNLMTCPNILEPISGTKFLKIYDCTSVFMPSKAGKAANIAKLTANKGTIARSEV